jgi:hypothetical protein
MNGAVGPRDWIVALAQDFSGLVIGRIHFYPVRQIGAPVILFKCELHPHSTGSVRRMMNESTDQADHMFEVRVPQGRILRRCVV